MLTTCLPTYLRTHLPTYIRQLTFLPTHPPTHELPNPHKFATL